jgi:hypothetical protein
MKLLNQVVRASLWASIGAAVILIAGRCLHRSLHQPKTNTSFCGLPLIPSS